MVAMAEFPVKQICVWVCVWHWHCSLFLGSQQSVVVYCALTLCFHQYNKSHRVSSKCGWHNKDPKQQKIQAKKKLCKKTATKNETNKKIQHITD